MVNRILIVEDEPEFRRMLNETLSQKTKAYLWEIEWAINGTEAIEKTRKFNPKIIMLDLDLPQKSGFQVIQEIENEDYLQRIIPLTGRFQEKDLKELTETHPKISEYIIKGKQNLSDYQDIIFQGKTSPESQFSYEELDPQVAAFISHKAREIQLLLRRQLKDIIQAGNHLHEVKEKLEHGQFERWLKSELNCSISLARKFMRTAQAFADVEVEGLPISPSAAYAIAQSTTPQAAKDELIKRAQQGETINPKLVKATSKKYQNQDSSETVTAQSVKFTDLPKQGTIVQIHKSPTWIELGPHKLYTKSPYSKQWCESLPNPITLLIFSPVDSQPSFLNPPPLTQEVKQYIALYSQIKYQPWAEQEIIESMVRPSLELMTEERDEVVFCYLYHPLLFKLTHYFDCKAIIAEPRANMRQQILKTWEEIKHQ